jgi:hypothetical protein
VIGFVLAVVAAPAFAGGIAIDLPRLDFPTPGTVSGSTMGCIATTESAPVAMPGCK